jgi:hypothetical protein
MVAPIGDIKKVVQTRLDEASKTLSFRLKVVSDRLEDGWLYLVVRPDRDGVHSEDYVQVLSRVEEQVEKERGIHLLLVPAAPTD